MGMDNFEEPIILEVIAKTQKAEKEIREMATKIKAYSQQMKADMRIIGQGVFEASPTKKNAVIIDAAMNLIDKEEKVAKKAALANEKLAKSLDATGKSATTSSRGMSQFWNTVKGTLTAMLVFNVLQGIQKLFTVIIEKASQAEQALIKLSIAEKSISAAGVDITPQELTGIAEKVANTYKSVSDIDASQMISNLAVLTKDLNLTAEQYEQLAMTIPLVAQQAGVSIDNATEQVITGLTKSGRGWADLGITIDAAIIREKAVSMGLVANAKAYENLTAEQKQQVEVLAELQILQENTIYNAAEQEKYNNTLAGSQVALNAEWEDFLSALGRVAAPTIIQFLQSLTKTLENLNAWIDKNSDHLERYSAQMAGFLAVLNKLNQIKVAGILGLLTGATNLNLKDTFKEAYLQAKQYNDDLKNLQDSPTGAKPIFGEQSEEELLKIEEEFEDLRNKIIEENHKLEDDKYEASIDLQIKLGDIEIDYAQKVEDIITSYNQKIEDLATDYANKIQDINTDSNNQMAEATANFHQEEINNEAEYQNELLKMREDYLMDLEDALHERDARQVLRLMKQYALDRAQAARDHALEKQQNAAAFKAEMAQIQAQKQQKLQAAQQEYQQKLEEAKLAKERELAEAELWRKREQADAARDYQNKLEELERHYQQRLEAMGRSLQAEYSLTAQQAGLLRSMLQGNLSAYASYTQQLMAQQQAMISQITASAQPAIGAVGYVGAVGTSPAKPTGVQAIGSVGAKFAEGGSVIANRPTTVTFGEGGMELATFTPMSRNGRDMNKLFSSLGGASAGGNGGGNVGIEIFLSPDLESRIINNTLSETANIMFRTRMSK